MVYVLLNVIYCTVNIQKLEEDGLLIARFKPGIRGTQKMFSLAFSFCLDEKISELVPDNLNISANPYISVRIGIKEDAEKPGGMNLFGEKFGNYSQNLIMKVELNSD